MQSKGSPSFLSDPKKRARARSSRGVALLIVLALLVLITGLVVAFFSAATNELASAKNYAGGSSSQQLADAATQLAIGSIRKATSDVSTNPSGTDVAWASQPGMIRTWDNKGEPRKVYKLFSASSLEAVAPYDPLTAGDLDPAFDAKPAIFTDLNAPVTDPAGAVHYPILDPFCSAPKNGNETPKIDGFYLGTPPTAAAVPNRVPMPVRWMYVLQDGKLIVPTSGEKAALFEGPDKPTATNPIVGRVAYWTDDETSKVNINTASEGVYWDLPRLLSIEDAGRWSGSGNSPTTPGLALTQPASGEYQRYPGHPATTSLSPILSRQVDALQVPGSNEAITASNIAKFTTYYDLLPRISQGGSYSGTKIPGITGSANNPGSIKVDSDRLFASVDEFLFKQPATSDPLPGRQVLASVNKSELKSALERSRFFLTAHSSAPEVTMFNTPRISMWPVWNDATRRTVLDSTLSFCANLKVNNADAPYYFTRQNSRSMTDDYLLSPRNQQLYAYLDKLMKTDVPGFGGKFSNPTAFGIDQAQVLTSIYDYIRCINLYDASNVLPNRYTKLVRMNADPSAWGGGEILPIKINDTQGFGRYATLSGIDLIFGAGGQPVEPNYEKVTSAQVMLVPTFFSPMQGLPGMYPKIKYTITALDGTFMLDDQPIFKAGGGIKGTNWITNAPVQQTEGRGMGGMISPRASLGAYGAFNRNFYKPFSHGENIVPGNPPTDKASSGAYPFISYNSGTSSNKETPNIDLLPTDATTPITVPKMKFVGGLLKVTISAADTGDLIQTFEIRIPDDPGIPRPKFTGGKSDRTSTNKPIFYNNGANSTRETNDPKAPPVQVLEVDSVRGVEVAGPGDDPADTVNLNTSAGDIRMIAALKEVKPPLFHAHKEWVNRAQASGLMDDDGININFKINTGATVVNRSGDAGWHGALAKGMYPRGSKGPAYGRRNPYVPSRAFTGSLSGVTRTNGDAGALGDWDTGYALLPDGAYLNMGDIGDQQYIDDVNNAYADDRGKPRYPYLVKEDHFNSNIGAETYFSPNRQVPSSMVLGSIPTGVQRFQPWQTLLFNPKPDDPGHPGRGSRGQAPPDHLIADLFWMPVVSPYPISQPFSTAGKINLNYQIQPFTYIERSTGIYALMKATKMMAIPKNIYGEDGASLPNSVTDPKPFLGDVPEINQYPRVNQTCRFPLNVKETLKGFEKTFAANDIFRSASQISEINLVPDDGAATYDRMKDFWDKKTLTGDNLREKPYADLYPRLTTKSNSYTVHYRVQVLQKLPNTPVAQWVEGRDQVGSEYRGSSEIERYLDSTDPTLPDYAALMASNPASSALNLDDHYRYRIVSTKRFSPY